MNKVKDIPVVLSGTDFFCAVFQSDNEEAICFYKGNFDKASEMEIVVRIHSGCITSEVFGMNNCDCKWQLDFSLKKIAQSEIGLAIYLPYQEGNGNGLFNKIKTFELMNTGLTSKESYELLHLQPDSRDYNFAIDILKYFGVKKIKLITNNPAKIMSCIVSDIIVTERIPVLIDNPNPVVQKLLESKKTLFNHYTG